MSSIKSFFESKKINSSTTQFMRTTDEFSNKNSFSRNKNVASEIRGSLSNRSLSPFRHLEAKRLACLMPIDNHKGTLSKPRKGSQCNSNFLSKN